MKWWLATGYLLVSVLLASPSSAQEHDHDAQAMASAVGTAAGAPRESDPAASGQTPAHLTQPATAAAHQHPAADAGSTMPQVHSAQVGTALVPGREEGLAMQDARHMSMKLHGDSVNWLLLGERFERLEGGVQVWEAQGWIGRDLNKVWFKTEGQRDRAETESAELQALYSRAIAPFWDLQVGLRHDGGLGADRSYAVLGLQGLAPYWFELDVATFLSEQGKASARLEAEYELRFSQRLLLQPRLELNYSFADDAAAGIGQGFSETSFGLRLRYELRREFAPYLGLEWTRAHGGTARLLTARDERREALRLLLGLRLWY